MSVRLTRRARSDIEGAADYYREISDDLGEAFLDVLEATVERVAMFPRSGRPVDGFPRARRARLRRFPYGLFYGLVDDEIVVLTVQHSKRVDPDLDGGES